MSINLVEYKNVYDQIRLKQYDAALNILFDVKTNRLRKQFKQNVNHSWYIVGDIFFKKESYFDAINFLKKSLNTRPDDVQALWAIADTYSELAKPKLSERYYRKAIQYAKKNEDLMNLTYNLGNALFDQKRYEEAISCYEKIDNSMPDIYKLAQKNIELFTQDK